MRILISGSTYHPAMNGQAIFTIHLAESLAELGHHVTMVYPSFNSKAESCELNGVRLESVRSFSLSFFHPDSHFPLPSGRRIRQIFDDFQPDIVHVQDHYPNSRSVVVEAVSRNIRVVGTNHFMPENLAAYIPLSSKLKRFYTWFMWTWVMDVYNRLDVVTTQSQAAADMLIENGLKVPVYTASCGIDLRRFYPDPSIDRKTCREYYGLDTEKSIFLFVGRIDREKRIDVLLRAIESLSRQDIQLVIAGKGAVLNELRRLAGRLKLGERVRFTGYIHEDLKDLLNSADVFVMPSEAELLSIASLEAMACGLPLLAADAVALPELVDEGVNGYLFKPGDVEDAARVIDLMADQCNRWPEMGKASQEKIEFHSLERTIHRFVSLYEAAVNQQSLEKYLDVIS